jgi:uncharacterized repeat protein (TIGR01451 family)
MISAAVRLKSTHPARASEGSTAPTRPRVLRIVSVLLVIVASSVVFTQPAAAATIRPFGIRFQADTNGAIDIFGNTLQTCPASAATCAAAQNPPNGNTTYYANNSFTMVQVDSDGAAFPTFNSSSSTVSFPATANVLFAGLYWGAGSTAAGRNQMKLRGPSDAAYTTITSGQLDANGSAYQAFADVTSFVAARGVGDYWGADVRANAGGGTYAGWALVVVWEDSSQPLRNLTVFDGYGTVANAAADRTIAIPLSGFLTPPFGPVQTEVGVVAYEGDRGQGATGDSFRLNSTDLSNAINPANDVFNGTISNGGASDPNRSPNYVNTLGFDADEFNASGILPNSSTSATVTLTTGGETFYPGVLTTAIDLYAPSFPTQTKTVTNLTRGTDPALPGDVLEYNLSIINTGLDPALSTTLTDALPPNTTFVPGSLQVLTGANSGAKTDGAGDDQGEYDGAARSVRLRLGPGATAAAGGTFGPNSSTSARFRVTVDLAASGTTLTNSFKLDYRAQTLNKPFTFTSNPVSTPVTELADLGIAKSAAPSPIVAGDPVTYTVTVTNNGPRPAQNVVITDTLPAGVTLVSATPAPGGTCAGSSCTIGAVPFPGTASVTYVVNAGSGLPAGSLLSNRATVTSTTGDPNPGNETTTITTPVVASADLRVAKTAAPAPLIAGDNVTWTISVVNDGPSTASAATVSDVLPPGVAIVSATPSAGSCTTAGFVSCALGDIADGATATVTVVATVAASATGSLVNTAAASSATPDPSPANNEGTATSTITRQNNLAVTKTAITNPVVPGTSAQWRITVANNGPSDTAAVTVTDPAPAGVTWTSASVAACTLGTTLSCPLSPIPAGSAVSIVVTGSVAANVPGGSTVANSATATSGAFSASGSSSTPVVAQVALVARKTASPDPVIAGTPLTYALTATNNGPSTATNVTVSDAAPSGVSFTGQTPSSGGSCAGSTAALVTCAFATLAPGASATVTITADVDAGVVGTAITNAATFDSDQTTPQDATFVSSVGQSADVYVTKSAVTASVVAGGTGTWRIVFGNNGPSNAQGVTVTDNLPAGMTITAISGGSCTGVGSATLACSQATLGAGASVTVDVTVAAAAAMAAGPAVNSVSISSSTPSDPTTSNNSASATMQVTRSADVSVTKSANGVLTPGLPYSWTVGVSNAGPSTADGVVVTDTLAPGLTFDPAASSAGCSASGQQVTCVVPSLASASPPANASVTIAVGTSASLTGGVPNTAAVSSTTPDPTPGNNSASATATVTPQSDVSVTKSAPASLTAGVPATWVVTVRNDGPSDATSITATDPPPAGVVWTSITSDLAGETCALGTGVCTLPSFAAGGVWTLTYRGDVSAAATGNIANAATVASPTDTTPGNNTANTSTPIVTQADLVVAKAPVTSPAIAGTPSSWVITVTNQGPSTARVVNLADTVSSGLTVQSLSSSGACNLAAGTCALGDIAPGSTVTINVTTLVGADRAGADVTNTAAVTSTTPDPNPSPPTVATLPVVGEADLSVFKEASAASFTAGGSVQWTVTVANNGPSIAANARITDVLPAGLSAVTATPTAGGCTVTTAVNCALGAMTPGQIIFVVIRGTLAAGTADGTVVTNTASAASDTTDSSPADNTASVDTPVITRADLRITKTAVSAPFVPGQQVTWTITVTNAGPSTARPVRIADATPAGVGSVTISPTTGCSLPLGATVRCTRASLAPGASFVYTLSGTLAPSFSAATLDNTATVDSNTADPDASNNAATATAPVAPTADVSIAKRVVGTPTAGGTITWELTVNNAGPSVASNVRVSDVVPAGVSGVTANAPSGTTCSGTATISCDTASLPVGAPVTITISGTLDSATSPSAIVSNTATVSSDTPDNDPADNSSTANTSVGTSADLTVAKAADGSFVAGQPASWTITVANAGPSNARAVTVADALPAALLSPGAVSSAGACTVSGASVSCALGDVAVGQVVTITVSGVIDSNNVGDVTNSVTVASTSPDPDPSDNAASATSPVAADANVSITKSASPAVFVAGQPAVYTLTVGNAGPSVARNVAVSDPPPAGIAVESVSGTLGACDTSVACTLGDLPVGASVTITVNVRPNAAFAHASNATNTAAVSSDTNDPTPADDTSSVTNQVRRSADVLVTKTAAPVSPPLWEAGEAGRYTLTVSNVGPSASGSLTISDTLPASVTFSSFAAADAALSCAEAAGVVTCTAADLPAGQSLSVIVEAVLGAGASPGAVDNTVAVAQTGADDPDPSNNSATTSISVATSADLAVSKTPAEASALAGTSVEWTIEVVNNGPSVARDVVVTDTLPAGLSWANVPTACVISGVSITCALGDVAVSGVERLRVTADIDPSQAAGQVVNLAEASSPTPDPAPDNNAGAGPLEVVRDADLRVSKQGSAASADAGTPVTWTLTAENLGPSTATNTVVTDALPLGLTFVPAGSDPRCGAAGSLVTCDLATLAPGAVETITLVTVIDEDATADPLTNVAQGSTTTPDSTPDNNSGDDEVEVTRAAALVVDKRATGAFVAGGEGVWTIVVRNDGPSSARGVVVTDVYPAGFTASTVATTAGVCGANPSSLLCGLGTLAVGQEVSVTITGVVAADATGTLTNTATAASPDDPDGAADTATGDVGVAADLAITKTGPASITAGQTATWTITVTNAGPAAAAAVVVDDPAPAGVTFAGATTSIGTCAVSAGGVSCAVGSLPPLGIASITVTGTVAAAVSGPLANTASASSATADAAPSNNSAAATSEVGRVADLAITKAASTTRLTAGQTIDWAIVVTNLGPSTAERVVVTDELPPELSPGALPAGCSAIGNSVRCERAALAVGEVWTIVLSTPARSAGSIRNTADVASSASDPSGASASAATQVVPRNLPGTGASPGKSVAIAAELLAVGVLLVAFARDSRRRRSGQRRSFV